MSIIQIYAPTLDKDDDVHDEFYEQLQATMESIKRSDYLIVLGDFNAILGNEKVPCVTGSHGTGIRNNSGQRLLEFCSANDLFVTNTGFRHHLRRKTTWISPDGRTKNEIDYILIRSRFKSSALNCRAYPKADCGSDHNLVAARLRLRFTAKKAITTTRKVRWNVDKLREEEQHEAYNEELAHVLRNTQSDSTIDNQWETIKTTITIAAKATIGKREMTAKQKWITPRTLELMEERKQLKPLITRSQEDKERYSLKDKEVRHACEENKKDYLEGICLHLQDCKHPSQAGIAYKYIRGLKKPFTLRSRTIKDAQDRPIDDTDEIRERWRGYTESLYTKDQTIHADWLAIPSIVVDPVPAVLPAEVTKTIRHINNNKAPGSDDLNIELIKAIDDDSKMMAQLTHLCNQIITEGKWPAEFRGSIYVPIYKKGDKMDCKNYRTIALIPHASKIVLGIIHQRMLSYYEQELSETQAGFRKDNGTRDQIMNMRLICEKQIEHSKNVYCCFIDYSKAFYCVDFELMWRTLLSFGIPKYLVECLKDLYQNQTAEVETVVGRTGPLSVQRGVRQGCPLSPMLFNMYSELIMRHALDKWEDGIEIGGKLYNNLRYADDVALLATTEGNLQQLVNDVGKASERFGLSLNAKKTQVMVIGRHTSSINIMYNGAPLEQDKQFIYLGASFNEKGDTIKEVKRRVAIAKRASGDLHRIWRNREIPIPLKKKLVQLMIWPIMSYGSETWIYLKSVQNMINVFERWCYRRMLRISWTEHVTNEEVFNRANTKPTLLDELLKRRLAFHGHLVRKGGITLDLMIGRLHGTRPRGRPRTTWLKDLTTHANISYKESMTIPRDRKKWRSVGNPRRTPDE